MKKILLVLIILCSVQDIICMESIPLPTEDELKLFQAVKDGNIEEVKKLIEAGATNFDMIRKFEGYPASPFTLAIRYGRYDIEGLFLLAESNHKFLTALEKDDVETALQLIGKVEKTTVSKALWDAIKTKNPEKVKIILTVSPIAGIDIDESDNMGNTALLLALDHLMQEVKNKNIRDTKNVKIIVDIINAILAEVPNPSLANVAGKSPLDVAPEIVKNAQQIVDKKTKEAIFELLKTAQITTSFKATQDQYTLFEALKSGNLDAVKAAMSPEFLKSNIQGVKNPLITAIASKNLDILKYIVEEGKKVNKNFLNQKLSGGFTPLTLALSREDDEMAKFFLQQGADPNTGVTFQGFNMMPLFIAILGKNIEMLEQLVKYKANINYQMSNNPNLTDNSTLLMFAVIEEKFVDMAKELLALGANPLLQNSDGETARDIATKKLETPEVKKDAKLKETYSEIITLLQEKEANFARIKPTTTPPSQLISALQKLTNTLTMISKMLLAK